MTARGLLADLASQLDESGLVVRGGFHPKADDSIPALPDGNPAATVVMIGNAARPDGDPMWRAFAAARARFPGRDPLNDWTRATVEPLAAAHGATALYPFGGPPHFPFQRWAMRAEPVAPSPIGLLIHPRHGLWHAYRAALVFAERLELPACDSQPSPCATCADKPCLTTCPVGAFTAHRYDVARCAAHLDTPEGMDDCLSRACRARRACPVGRDLVYAPAQARFHMQAFRRGVTLG